MILPDGTPELTFREALRRFPDDPMLGPTEQFNEQLGPGPSGERAIRYGIKDGELVYNMHPQVAAVIRKMSEDEKRHANN